MQYVWVKLNPRSPWKSSIQLEEGSFHQQTGLKFKEKNSEVLHLEHSFVWSWNLDTLKSRSEVPGKFLNVVLEKDGEDQLVQVCEKWEVLHRDNEERNILHTIKRRKAKWIGHILHRNCLLKHATAAKIDGQLEVTGRWKTTCEQLLNNLKEMRGYWELKKEALDCTLWEAHFRRGYGPAVRQTTEWWMNDINTSVRNCTMPLTGSLVWTLPFKQNEEYLTGSSLKCD